ncbi:expressed unknown protein [Seminavis robusta]|uniref:SnoaL-like domain-containing protein n=1 Tax=Seminavis robusta TaxID=568900 RepID=A0A9N8HJ45_9STRA|nr:expressed unknown protein [Seminavis robusta]|eukprot:Sro832_g208480.1 n/a (203) ;mRNA; r:35915-36523
MGFLKLITGSKAGKSKHKGGSKQRRKQNDVDASLTVNESQVSNSSFKFSNEQIIEQYMAAKNRHASVEELLEFWTSDKAKAKFDDHGSMTARQLLTEINNLNQGFEDMMFTFESIEEVEPGVVLVEQLVVTGTHTSDLKFMDFPVIPKTNRHVVLDPERLYFTVKNGKITKMEDTALGNLTGPPGMYMAVGGKLIKPSKQEN